MSVNIFKNGILSKIAGAVGDAVPLINNFLTNQEGKGAADANTVYVLNNKIEELNNSLTVERVVLNTQAYSGSKDISIEGNVPTNYKLLLASVDIVGDNTRKVTYSLHYTDEQYSVYGSTNDSNCSCTITVYGLCVKNK